MCWWLKVFVCLVRHDVTINRRILGRLLVGSCFIVFDRQEVANIDLGVCRLEKVQEGL